MLPRRLMQKSALLLGCACLLIGACAAFKDDPYVQVVKRYAPLEAQLGKDLDPVSLPMVDRLEHSLGKLRQSNGRYVRDDGTFERKVGSGSCLYAFRIDPQTSRIVSWRMAGAESPSQCH